MYIYLGKSKPKLDNIEFSGATRKKHFLFNEDEPICALPLSFTFPLTDKSVIDE